MNPFHMHVSKRGVKLVARFEGFRSRPYKPIPSDPWTIGYGETQDVGPSTGPWGKEYARRQLAKRLDRDYATAIRQAVKVPLSQRQFDALASFIYNVGVGSFVGSTLLRELNQRHYAKAANQFLAWDKAGGRRLEGLTRRRRAERRLFLRGSDLRTRLRAAGGKP